MPAFKEISYSDLDLNLTPHPLTGEIQVKSNADSVKQSVVSLVLTNLGDRFFHHEIGSDTRRSLFENFGEITAMVIKKRIETVIQNQEPRALLESVSVGVEEDKNRYAVKIVFRPINLTTPVIVDFFLERTR